ncbi:hypothetical protein [Streptomyces alfalfae]|uniref:UL36 very large tegument protein n=1 Tax=Streptomyces alfalfae TaxID=1642299 RepID=A0A7T4U0C6_9ACTN|nr:hypothetical protein [Streptomyces alfalfae]QQC92190.1 hypothetical protein I8755_30165 [Streptomyces alfalfae]
MTVGQLPDQVGEFAKYLRELVGRLDQGAGWCGVFWQRDPDGMRACLDGVEVPPWDVVQALLHDLAADRGVAEAEREAERARTLHRASLTAYDARPGARELLSDRLDMMLREQRIAAEREAELTRRLAGATGPEADGVGLDLAWVRDDHERASARCVELRERMDRLDAAERPTWVEFGPGAVRADPGVAASAPGRALGDVPATEAASPGPWFEPALLDPDDMGGMDDRGDPYGPDGGHAPDTGAPHDTSAPYDTSAAYDIDASHDPGAPHLPGAPHDTGPHDAPATVELLARLRKEGRSGEAHGVLVEVAGWPADRLPELAGELHRAGLGADWATLLWEAASLPPDRLVALADALAGAGRADDCRKLLRQGVARPAPEIAEAILALLDAGREREARALLDSYHRVRTPEDAAACAHAAPHRLIPLLLETARAVSEEHHWDLVHALRVAGFSA